MKKELLISAKFDTSDFDKSVENMQKKLREIYAPSDAARQRQTSENLQKAGYGPLAGAPGTDQMGNKNQEYKRNLDKFIREEKVALENKVKLLDKEQSSYKKINEQYQAVIKAGKEDLKLKEQLKDSQEAFQKAKEDELNSETKINALLREKHRMNSLPANTPGNPGGGAPKGPMATASGIAGGLGTAATIAAAVGTAAQYFAELPMRRTESLGNAQKSMYGDQLGEIASGNTVSLIAQASKRQEALQRSNQITNTRQMTDLVGGDMFSKLFSGDVKGAFAGGGRTAELWGGNLLSQAGQNLSDPRQLASHIPGMGWAADKLKGGGESMLSNYHAGIESMRGEDYQRILTGLNNQDPLLNLASKRLQDRGNQDLGSQRMMGLSDDQMFGHGGFQETANKGGFNQDLRAQMAATIASAGGSTRAMSGQASMTGLQAERNFDLTNAGQVLGRVSGAAGTSQASNDILKKILEESVKSGLDKSEFREEQRKFADITSSIISNAGLKSGTDAESALKEFSKYMGGDKTMKGMQGAQSAYQEAQGFSSETSGRGGAIQFAEMSKQGLSSLGAMGMAGLMEMPENQLSPDDPFVIGQALKAKMTPQEVVKRTKAAKRGKQLNEVGANDKNIQKVNEYLKSKNLTGKDLTWEEAQKMPEDVQAAYAETQNYPTARSTFENPQKRQAAWRGLMGQGQGEEMGPATASGQVEATLAKKPERIQDKELEASGVAAQAMLENFRDFKKVLDPANISFGELIKNVILFQQVLSQTPEKDKAATLQGLAERAKNNPPPKQQQGGKP
jgi:hypothetical protein